MLLNFTLIADKFMVSGHTPTLLIDNDHYGRIIQMNRHIAVDCGVSQGFQLDCICLDTMQKFYC